MATLNFDNWLTSKDNNPIASQLAKYLSEIEESSTVSAIDFWSADERKFNLLIPLVKQVLADPAASAPVERVFRTGGLMMRPHRSRVSGQFLSDLVFLK